jgi:hypothetical protein
MGAGVKAGEERAARAVPGWLPLFPLAVFAVLVVKIGWVADSGLVVLRSALNATNGWGAGFNPSAPTQEFDSPLWFFVWSRAGSLFGEWVATMFALSFVFSLAAIGLVLWRSRSVPVLVGASCALLASTAFMEFTSSGLEQPLAFLSVGLLFVVVLRVAANPTSNGAGLVGAFAALVTLTSPELLVVVAPLVVYVVVRNRRVPGFVVSAVGVFALPLAVWAAWTQSTFGTFVPPSLAETFSGWSGGDLWDSLRSDPVTLAVIAAGAVYLLWRGAPAHRFVVAGVAVYLLWVALAGSTALPGQRLAVPFYLIVLASVDRITCRPSKWWQALWSAGTVVLFTLTAVALSVAGTPVVTVAAWTGPGGGDTGWSGAVAGHLTFTELFTGSDAVEYAPFQPGEFLVSYDGPLTINSVRAAADGWPPTSDTEFIAQGQFGTRCERLGVNGMLSGPLIEWETNCTEKR